MDPSVARAFLAAAAVFLIDIASKAAVVAALPYGSSEPWLPVLNIVHWRNEGAAFSFLHDAGGWQRLFFSAVAVAASVVFAVLIRRPQTGRPQRLAFGLLLGGALGNLLDRLARGAWWTGLMSGGSRSTGRPSTWPTSASPSVLS